MGRQKAKKVSSRTKRYATIDPNKPLTPREKIFVSEYIRTRNGTQSAITAGYSEKNARYISHDFINNKPNTQKAIERQLGRYFERLEFDAFDVLKKIGDIAFGDIEKILSIENGRVKVKDSDVIPEREKNLFAGAEEIFDKDGSFCGVKVKTHDPVKALDLLARYYQILDKARAPHHAPLEEQEEALLSVRQGQKTVVEACLDLELKGIAIPETLRILLSKHSENEEDPEEGEFVIPTPEEMQAKREQKLKEIEKEKEEFLPQRQEEVLKIKKELGKANLAFKKEPVKTKPKAAGKKVGKKES